MKANEFFRHLRINVKTLVFKLFSKEIGLYILFGVLTTAVDWIISFTLYKVFDSQIDANKLLIHAFDTVAWIGAVLFAFFTNRIFVFKSDRKGKAVLVELIAFAGGRVLTLLLQEGIILLFFNIMGINKYAVKIGAAVLVVIINYFFGKFIFKKKNQNS